MRIDPQLGTVISAMESGNQLLVALAMQPFRPKSVQKVRVEELARIASDTDSSGIPKSMKTYAHEIVRAMDGMMALVAPARGPVVANAYISDAEILRRFDVSLNGLAPGELHALAENLLRSPDLGGQELRYVRDLVERQAEGAAERAMLGRRFTILCVAVANRVPHERNAGALENLYGWDWSAQLCPHHDAQALASGPLAFVVSAAYRGLRRLVVTAFMPDLAAKDHVRRIRKVRADAASAFLQAYRQTVEHSLAMRPISASGARQPFLVPISAPERTLAVALSALNATMAHRETAEHAVSGASPAHSEKYEAAYRDALSHMPGELIDTLGRYCTTWGHIPCGAEYSICMAPLRNALRAERAIRAATEVVRTLAFHVAREERAAMPGATPLHGRSQDPGDGKALLNYLQSLDQRYRLVDAGFAAGTFRDFIRSGLMRLPLAERDGFRDALCDPDWRPPAWLRQDELLSAVLNAFQ